MLHFIALTISGGFFYKLKDVFFHKYQRKNKPVPRKLRILKIQKLFVLYILVNKQFMKFLALFQSICTLQN